jgi:thymidylate synthase (FAD)
MMQARLISYTQPTEAMLELGLTDAKELVAYCARVSNPGNQINSETSERLINYLIKHKHWSPLEMASACIEITTTRDIARQILRHRSFSFQEFSQRYAAVDTDSFVLRDARLQDKKNRQNSIEIDDRTILDPKTLMNSGWLKEEWRKQQRKVIEAAKEAYEWALANNIAKEQARAVLPEGLTPSTMYMNGTLRSWVHYIELRSDNGTQKEHREVALACAEAIAKIWPMEYQ